MINELGDQSDEQISLYKNAEFIDLCRGPHVPSTGKIKAFKLTKLAGAYWRADSQNKQLQRVYGIAFPDKKMLKEHLKMLEEAEKRDHRKLGKDLELFSFHEEAPGMPFFHDKGMVILSILKEFMAQQMKKRDYQINQTPIVLNKELWLKSGHWNHYSDNMYFTKIDNKENALKPMNCPGNLLIYKARTHSYRELPIRAGEFGIVHRHELSGVLSGLFRVRFFTQDDAHVFCTEKQLESEIEALVEFIDFIYKTFGFEYMVELSTRPKKAMGSVEIWDKATDALKNVLKKKKYDFKINEGDGAFYGPKIDFHLKDAIGRMWQCGTIQVDFSMPEKFDLEYEGKDGRKHRPVMLHRAIYGSFERFFGILIEHYAGRFPLWISPVQVKVLAITDRQEKYVMDIYKRLRQAGLRAEFDLRTETVNYKIRDAQLKQINYILVVGDKEVENKTINVRTREGKVEGEMKVDDLINRMKKEIEEKV
jgi:threonyl-tRNA synthetase